MLKYAFISVVAVTYAEWKGKAFHKVLIGHKLAISNVLRI